MSAQGGHNHRRSVPSFKKPTTPLLVADYCFVHDCQENALATVLVWQLYPSKALFATMRNQLTTLLLLVLPNPFVIQGTVTLFINLIERGLSEQCLKRHAVLLTGKDHVITQSFGDLCLKNHRLERANRTVKPKAKFKDWKTRFALTSLYSKIRSSSGFPHTHCNDSVDC